jgi:hypothetical protein
MELTSQNPIGLHALSGNIFTDLYTHYSRTSQETPPGHHGLLRGQLNVLYVDDVRTSQDTYVQGSAAGYKNSFTFFRHWNSCISLMPLKNGVF